MYGTRQTLAACTNTIKYGQNRGGYRARRGGYSRTLGTTCVLTLGVTCVAADVTPSPNVGPRHVMPNVRNLVARRACTNPDVRLGRGLYVAHSGLHVE